MNLDRNCAVVDTSTLISVVLKPQSVLGEAFKKIRKQYELVASLETLQELSGVLSRNKFDAFRPYGERMEFFELYCTMVKIYSITVSVNDCRDANDNKFLELALSSRATLILSSDPDLLVLNPYHNISIINPRSFITP